MEINLKKGRVAAEHKGAYVVICEGKELLARVTGKQMFVAQSREDYPAVGDWVVVQELPENNAVIKEILPRKTIIKRRFGDRNKSGIKTDTQIIAANIDAAFVVQSVGRDYSLNRFERYFTLLEAGGVEPVAVLNKIDAVDGAELEKMMEEIKKRFNAVKVVAMSAKTGAGANELAELLENGKTYCFLGSSGVGKSTIINWLLKKEIVATGEVSQYSGRGKHITTSRQMYFLPNKAIVIDNPGIREVGFANEIDSVGESFDEIIELSRHCKYADCTHTNEPGCKVLKELEAGILDRAKHENYVKIKKETDYYVMDDAEKREKKKNFGKFVNRAKKSLKNYNIKDY